MHIQHTIEQLEGALCHQDKIAAVQILRRHYKALGAPYTLSHLAHLVRLYWKCPPVAIQTIPTRKEFPKP